MESLQQLLDIVSIVKRTLTGIISGLILTLASPGLAGAHESGAPHHPGQVGTQGLTAWETIFYFGVIPVVIFLLISALTWVVTGEKGLGLAGLERPQWDL